MPASKLRYPRGILPLAQRIGGMDIEQLKQLQELETENARLKRVVADLNLEKAMLAEAARGNFLSLARTRQI